MKKWKIVKWEKNIINSLSFAVRACSRAPCAHTLIHIYADPPLLWFYFYSIQSPHGANIQSTRDGTSTDTCHFSLSIHRRLPMQYFFFPAKINFRINNHFFSSPAHHKCERNFFPLIRFSITPIAYVATYNVYTILAFIYFPGECVCVCSQILTSDWFMIFYLRARIKWRTICMLVGRTVVVSIKMLKRKIFFGADLQVIFHFTFHIRKIGMSCVAAAGYDKFKFHWDWRIPLRFVTTVTPLPPPPLPLPPPPLHVSRGICRINLLTLIFGEDLRPLNGKPASDSIELDKKKN